MATPRALPGRDVCGHRPVRWEPWCGSATADALALRPDCLPRHLDPGILHKLSSRHQGAGPRACLMRVRHKGTPPLRIHVDPCLRSGIVSREVGVAASATVGAGSEGAAVSHAIACEPACEHRRAWSHNDKDGSNSVTTRSQLKPAKASGWALHALRRWRSRAHRARLCLQHVLIRACGLLDFARDGCGCAWLDP